MHLSQFIFGYVKLQKYYINWSFTIIKTLISHIKYVLVYIFISIIYSYKYFGIGYYKQYQLLYIILKKLNFIFWTEYAFKNVFNNNYSYALKLNK